jgi:Ca2+:H+ antiporter
VNSKLLLLAAIGLVVPSVFHFTTSSEIRISIEISLILFVAYLASLGFTLVTHRQLFTRKQAEGPVESGKPAWSRRRALVVLAASTAVLAVVSEVLTDAIEPAAQRLHLSPAFAGIFVLATVGNASGLLNAVQFARRDRMDLTVAVTLGAGTQAALLVAPVLVLSSLLLFRQPMDLLFTPFEVVSIGLAVLVGRTITVDGESNWLEGVLLVAVYAMLGIGFFHLERT